MFSSSENLWKGRVRRAPARLLDIALQARKGKGSLVTLVTMLRDLLRNQVTGGVDGKELLALGTCAKIKPHRTALHRARFMVTSGFA